MQKTAPALKTHTTGTVHEKAKKMMESRPGHSCEEALSRAFPNEIDDVVSIILIINHDGSQILHFSI